MFVPVRGIASGVPTISNAIRNASQNGTISPQKFHSFLILDFEATCDQNQKSIQPIHEIIEFPVVKLNAETFEIEERFHHYVCPTVNPQLTSFCTNLTGIVQGMVDGKPSFAEAMQLFHQWLKDQHLLCPEDGSKSHMNFSVVTCGDWDIGTLLARQAAHFDYSLPWYFKTWINLKVSFSEALGYYPNSMMSMLRDMEIPHQGRHHSGIDDVINMCAIMKTISKTGYVFRPTAQLKEDSRHGALAINPRKFGSKPLY
ncbi:hypothetical protein L596_004415 [Steinernema carpocapsae]|uniref:Exonuclease domain-containing protein n=1 Tax=Steinernema carpocapsae TaxID=34508 RepID=A0A4U8UX90_STECR|nr:hypothetical protein L596_004415 [Steinernema carpocapsae]